MIVKMVILRLLGSSDEKFEDWRDREETKSKKSRQIYFSITGWTDARKVEYVGAMNSATEAKSIHWMNRR